MADEEQELELEVEGGGGKSKMLLIIIGAVAVLLIGAGAAWFFLSGEDDSGDSPDSTETTEQVDEVKAPAIYIGVPEAIVSPVAGESKDRIVQIKMSFVVRSPESEDLVKKHMPRLKNDLLMLVSASSADRIITPEGRNELQTKCLEVVQQTMKQLEGAEHVEKVLFVSFVMQ
ncbi:MAG: flagellar basal body-associated FliL family protein [Gammaproteobacteria bacterium]|nr:flagellar basal body-associated FliL family protein [Gammaproteobacteria bacterium]